MRPKLPAFAAAALVFAATPSYAAREAGNFIIQSPTTTQPDPTPKAASAPAPTAAHETLITYPSAAGFGSQASIGCNLKIDPETKRMSFDGQFQKRTETPYSVIYIASRGNKNLYTRITPTEASSTALDGDTVINRICPVGKECQTTNKGPRNYRRTIGKHKLRARGVRRRS